MPLWGGCKQACESSVIRTFVQEGEGWHSTEPTWLAPLRRVKTELQHIGITEEEGTTEKGRNWCELTARSPGLNSLSWSPDFHQDNQGVFGKQCNE